MQDALARQPFPLRFAGYLQERFPPLAHLPLIALFHVSASRVAVLTGGEGRVSPAAGLIVLLAFFHLRVFDEQKDALEDRQLHPERLLSRGVISLGELGRMGLLAVAVEALLAALLGPRVLLAWVLAFTFSLLMRWEFGAATLLRGRPVLYALTHNPIVALLAVVSACSAEAPLTPRFGWYLGAVSLASLAFELGRKSERYVAAVGLAKARALSAATALAASACLGALLMRTADLSLPLALGAGLAPTLLACAVARPWRPFSPGRSAGAGALHLFATLCVALLSTLG